MVFILIKHCLNLKKKTLSEFGTTEQLVDGQQVLKIEVKYTLKTNNPTSDGHFSSPGPALYKLSKSVRHTGRPAAGRHRDRY
jgi:hypothetical protein